MGKIIIINKNEFTKELEHGTRLEDGVHILDISDIDLNNENMLEGILMFKDDNLVKGSRVYLDADNTFTIEVVEWINKHFTFK